MGAVIDINIVSELYYPVKDLLDVFCIYFGSKYEITKIEIIDNWEYANSHYIESEVAILDYINDNKMLNLYATINDYNIGLQMERRDNIYQSNLWLNTKEEGFLSDDSLNTKNYEFFKIIIGQIDNNALKYKINVVAMGYETIFEYNKNYAIMFQQSYNILIWMIKKSQELNNFNSVLDMTIKQKNMIVLRNGVTINPTLNKI